MPTKPDHARGESANSGGIRREKQRVKTVACNSRNPRGGFRQVVVGFDAETIILEPHRHRMAHWLPRDEQRRQRRRCQIKNNTWSRALNHERAEVVLPQNFLREELDEETPSGGHGSK